MSQKVTLTLDLESGSIEKPFKDVEKQAKQTGSKAGKSISDGLSKGFGSVLKLAAPLAAAASAIAGAFTLREAIRNAQIQEDAVNRLNSALQATGKFSQSTSKELQNFASDLQQVSKFGDEAILESIALTQSLADLDTKGLKRATQASLDLASALKIDLTTASQLVARAANGQISTFTRYGIQIEKGRTEAETFENTLRTLEQRFGGRAQSEVNTFSGAIAQLKNNFGDTLEEIGFFITKNPFLIEAIKQISQSLSSATKGISEFFKSIDFFKDVITPILNFNDAIINFVVAPLELLSNVASSVFDNIRLLIQGFVARIGQIGGILGDALNATGFASESAQSLKNFAASSASILQEFKAEVQQNDIFDFSVSAKLAEQNEQLRLGLESFNQTIIDGEATAASLPSAGFSKPIEDATKSIREQAEKARAELEKLQADVNRIINQGLTRTISGGIQNIASSLAQGKNLFQEFGSFLLASFGDLAIQLGEFYIAKGLADLALFGGAGASIAAGAALIGVGAILKSFFGGSSGSSPSGAGAQATGGTTSGFDQSDLADVPVDLQRQEKDKSVQVVIQGNVFDSEETGTSIAKILSDAFGKQGVKLAGSGLA
jgi:hypothetical protein